MGGTVPDDAASEGAEPVDVLDRGAWGSLDTAYPDERDKAHALRWLGWVTARLGEQQRIEWWLIPGLGPERAARTTRWLTFAVIATAVFGLVALYLFRYWPEGVFGYLGFIWIDAPMGAWSFRRWYGWPTPKAPKPTPPLKPRAIVPRRLRARDVRALVAWSNWLGFGIGPRLVYEWAVPAADQPGAAPASTYRADRATCLWYGLSWAPLALAHGLPLVTHEYAAWLALIAINGAVGVMMVACWAGPYPLLKFSELVLWFAWRERVNFVGLLETAADRGLLRRVGAAYEFADADVRARLLASGQAAIAAHERLLAERVARKGARGWAVRSLTRWRKIRISRAAGVGGLLLMLTPMPGTWWINLLKGLGTGAFLGVLLGLFVFWLLSVGIGGARWSLQYLAPWSKRQRLAGAILAGATVAGLVMWAGPALARALAFVLPTALVVGTGAWATWLALARTRRSAKRWRRAVPDVLGAVTVGASLWVAIDRSVLTHQAAAVLLFPVAGWGTLRLWRAMRDSDRLAARSGAAIALSALLGVQLAAFLVWLANQLGMSPAEMTVLRSLLQRIGTLADPPWWVWTGSYTVLAALAVAAVRRPGKLVKTAVRTRRWSSGADVVQQAMTGAHIGLMALVLVGLVAPPEVRPLLASQLDASYTVAYQRELAAEGETAAYQAIAAQLFGTPSVILTAIVTKIHDISPPGPGDPDATSTETDIARRLGEEQAAALGLAPASSTAADDQAFQQQAADAAAAEAGIGEQPQSGKELLEQVQEVQAKEEAEREWAKRTESAADLATKVIASMIMIPQVSSNEAFQIVREYLGALIEGSYLKDMLAAWFEHAPGATAPADAKTMVIPDPPRLEHEAIAALSDELAAEGFPADSREQLLNPTPLFGTEPASADSALSQDPLDAAVDLVNQNRYQQEETGPCSACEELTYPGEPADEHPGNTGQDEGHPAEP